ncbi:MAG: prolyl aminopeptidase [Dehalococcoidia bacterium]
MSALYPEIAPFEHGLLPVGGGHSIYWESCGNPRGRPAVVLHGGPGSGCSAAMRRYFDPGAYRVVLFDQRGCGRSSPHASEPATDLATNTTWHLAGDIERLRVHLGIDRWLVYGGSWGSTLGLAYAEAHPDRVTAMVLAGVTTTRPSEIDWLYGGVAPLFPAEWERFVAGASAVDRKGDVIEAYHALLHDPDPAICTRAAADFHDWEFALMAAGPAAQPSPGWLEPRFQLARARIVTHYFRHNAWLEDGVLLREAGKLAGIPGVLVQGRLDLAAPLVTAWELARAWPGVELAVVDGAGHSPGEPGMSEAIVTATDRFATG